VLLLALAGCGGDGSDGGDGAESSDDLAGSIADDLVRANDPGRDTDSFLTDDEARCIAEALLVDPGRAALEEAGILSDDGDYSAPEGVDPEVGEAWAAAHGACIDLRDHLTMTARIFVDGFADEPAPEAAWQKAFACVRRSVTPAEAEAVVAASATGAEVPTSGDDEFNACIDAVASP
jgi:hypothetical protein